MLFGWGNTTFVNSFLDARVKLLYECHWDKKASLPYSTGNRMKERDSALISVLMFFFFFLFVCLIFFTMLIPRGYLVKKIPDGDVPNMGSKISLEVYQWPLILLIWHMNGYILKIWFKFFFFKLKKSGNLGQNLAPWSVTALFLWKLYMYLYGSTFKFTVACPYKNQNLSTMGLNYHYSIH